MHASVDGVILPSVRIPTERLPNLDLQNTKVYGYRLPEPMIVIEMRFGELSDCYINEVWPDVRVYLGPVDHPVASITTYDGCEIRREEIALDR